MEIKNIEGLSAGQLRQSVSQGGKMVIYKYCISIVFASFNRPSSVYFIKPATSEVTPGLKYLFVSLLLGWWGIPWGPIYTIGNIFNVLSGGTDVTQEVMSSINQNDTSYGTGNNYNIPNANATAPTNSTNSSEGARPIYNIN